VKKKEKLPQENNTLFVYFFHSVEVCCMGRVKVTIIEGNDLTPKVQPSRDFSSFTILQYWKNRIFF
jgi:hypothetical protein